MNKFEVRHLRHQNSEDYSLTMETQDRMMELVAGKHASSVVFYEVSPNEMLDLADQIIQIAFKIRDREEQDATVPDVCKSCTHSHPEERGEYAARTV